VRTGLAVASDLKTCLLFMFNPYGVYVGHLALTFDFYSLRS
jgi:hypothetical protein